MSEKLIRSKRIEGMGVSGILLLAQKAREIKEAGLPVIDLSAGQPDLDTPANVRQAAARAIEAGETRYTALDGTAAMKDAIRHKFASDNALDFDRSEVMACAGAHQPLQYI